MKKILIVFGTRPEAIKMAPLINEFKNYKESYEVKVCVTGQHRELLAQVLDFFEIIPDYDLQLMKDRQDLSELSAAVLLGMKSVLETFPADYLFVHGDTTTSTFAALAGFYAGVKVCHVEAGLRTYNLNFPFPEEANRQLTARIAFIHFTPTLAASTHLINEGISAKQVFLTGNTIIDALMLAGEKINKRKYVQLEKLKQIINSKRRMILVTCHRRENFGDNFNQICNALKEIAENNDVQIIYPVHLNPNVRESVHQIIGQVEHINLVEPLEYPTFIWLMKTCHFIITDSGGVQEEGTALGKSILLMREHTERPEVVASGQVKLVGANKDIIVKEATKLLNKNNAAPQIPKVSPYGIGDASKQILTIMANLKN